MKNIAKIFIAGVITLSAATATAGQMAVSGGYDEVSYTKTFTTGAAMTQEAAYQLGLEKLQTVSGKSSLQLSRMLPGSILEGSAHVKNNGYISVIQQMGADGSVEYVAVASIPVHYQQADSSR